MTKTETVNCIMQRMLSILDNKQLKALQTVLDDVIENGCNNSGGINHQELFIAAKRIEGCSEKTLSYYNATISAMQNVIKKSPVHITTDDLRAYLLSYQTDKSASKTTVDNVRRILSSFFSWLEDEDYIVKSPIRRIHKVRTAITIKETYTDEELEIMRDYCSESRDLAIIDMLSSTGMRIGEMVLLNRVDIDFNERECVVLGKGAKERVVYFDARTKIHLKNYLNQRTDNNPALFVSLKNPHTRLKISSNHRRGQHDPGRSCPRSGCEKART